MSQLYANPQKKSSGKNFVLATFLFVVFSCNFLFSQIAKAADGVDIANLEIRLPAKPLCPREKIRVTPVDAYHSDGKEILCLVETPRYRISTICEEETAITLAQKLEEVADMLETLLAEILVENEDKQENEKSAPQKFRVRIYRDKNDFTSAMRQRGFRGMPGWGFYDYQTGEAHFFPADDSMDDFDRRYTDSTLLHEATHQFLHARLGKYRGKIARDAHYWIVEGIAIYAESLRRVDENSPHAKSSWILGGWENDRMKAAIYREQQGFFVPLENLCALGEEKFQGVFELPKIYSQLGGITTFLMAHHRAATLNYLNAVYKNSATAKTLPQLLQTPLSEIDAEYRKTLRDRCPEKMNWCIHLLQTP